MFQGLRTVIYRVNPNDLEKAKAWYAKLVDKQPYFDEPFYVGFNVGGYELGIDPGEEKVTTGDNVHAYWGVENIDAIYERCLTLGAKTDTAPRDVGGGIKVATVKDPFGNVVGLIQNPHFKLP